MALFGEIARYWHSGGPAMLPIAIASVGVWFYFLRARARLVAVTATPADFEDRIAARVRNEPLEQVAGACRAARGALTGAVAHMLEAARRGEAPPQAFAQCEQIVLTDVGHDVLLLAALTGVAPLLGLLGTVGGMIATFRAVGGAAGGAATHVSAGVSQALITTQFGLMVAIPGVFGVARLQRLITQARVRFASCRGHLLLALGQRSTEGGRHATRA